jgi:predicted dehydrogenase
MASSVRLGLVGAGAWGRNYLRTARADGLHVSCVCRATAVPVDGFAEVPVTDDLGQLLRSCDAVVVATPPASHEGIVLQALASGKPVLLEKPAALSASSVERMITASEVSRVPLLVAHIHLFSPAFSALRDSSSLMDGPLQVVSLAGNSGPFRDYSSLWDWGPHDVSMCLSVMGRAPDDVEAVRHVHDDGGTVDIVSLGFQGSRADLTFGNGLPKKVRAFSVSPKRGLSVTYSDGPTPALLSSDGGFTSFRGGPSPLKVMLDSFYSVVSGSASPDWRYEPWIALETARILDLADHVTSIRRDRFLLEP